MVGCRGFVRGRRGFAVASKSGALFSCIVGGLTLSLCLRVSAAGVGFKRSTARTCCVSQSC